MKRGAALAPPHHTAATLGRCLLFGVIVGLLLGGCVSEQSREPSPDGRFEVVIYRSRLASLVPMMPGQGSDAPGRVEIIRRADGRSCGTAAIPMVQLAYDIQFSAQDAVVIGFARWDLVACSVDTSGW